MTAKMMTIEPALANAGARIGNRPIAGTGHFGGWSPKDYVSREVFVKKYKDLWKKGFVGKIFDVEICVSQGYMFLHEQSLWGNWYPVCFTTVPCKRDVPVWVGNNLLLHPNGEEWGGTWGESHQVTPDEFKRLVKRVPYEYQALKVQRCMGFWYYQDYQNPVSIQSRLVPIAFC